jgi:hypothetical protein
VAKQAGVTSENGPTEGSQAYAPAPLPAPPEPPTPGEADSLSKMLEEATFISWQDLLYRVQEDARLGWTPHAGPRYRFDALAVQYRAIYANNDPAGAIGERFAETGRVIDWEHADLHVLSIEPQEPLEILDLRADETLAALSLDPNISTGHDYALCQKWATRLHAARPTLSGMRYQPRKGGERCSNVVLFGDRCHEWVEIRDCGILEDLVYRDGPLGGPVTVAQSRYKLRVRFL